MQVIVIFGPPAVGKMTVGIELSKLSGYKLFHNHMTIELANCFYSFEDKSIWKLSGRLRHAIFAELAENPIEGLIFTYVWALDQASDKRTLERYMKTLRVNMEDVFFVELEADQKTRLERNKTELRLKHKKSKNNVAVSEKNLTQWDKTYKMNSGADFFYPDKYIKINNQELDAEIVAKMIVERLGLNCD